jgi:two-component sensor histidine kinase
MSSELWHYLSLFKDLYNPFYYSFFLILLIIVITWLIRRKIVIPVKKQHEIEKRRLELDNLRIIAAFSESDPNPVVRTDIKGNIIHFNKSAQMLFGLKEGENINISLVAPGLNYDFQKEIDKGSNIQFDLSLGDKFFKVHFYGIKILRMARIYFVDLTERNNYEKKIIESEQKYRSLSFYLQDHLETEKQRIGLELHDSIGQNLFLIKLKLNDPSSGYEKHAGSLDEINRTMDRTIDELREIMFNLRPRSLEELGLFSAVRMMSDNFSKSSKSIGSIDYVGTPVRLDGKIELYLFRIIQESLSNILKHSEADKYHIQFVYSADYLKILIADNGIGFDPDNILNLKHYGLLNMSERIKTLNGKMKITSSDREGTSLLFELPYEVT